MVAPAIRVTGRVDRRVLDVLLVLGGLFLTALAVKTPWSTLPRPAIVVTGVVASLALPWVRRWPLPVVGAATVAAVAGNPGPLLVAAFTATLAAGPATLPVLAGLASAGFVGPTWVDEPWPPAASELLSGLGVAAVVMAAAGWVRTRRDLLESLRERATRAEAERLLRVEQARAHERTRIAREMHDVIAHKVSLISLHAGALEVNAGAGQARVEEGATLIRETAHEALDELRAILGLLRDSDGGASDGVPPGDVGGLVGSWRRAGATVELDEAVAGLPPATARTVHRVVQEGLTNAHKHAPGAAVRVSVAGDRHRGLSVVVANGPPPRPEPTGLPGAGAGLTGLAERLRLAGGTLEPGPDGSGGWRLTARLPWEPS